MSFNSSPGSSIMWWNLSNLKATLLLLCCFCVEICGGSSELESIYRDLSRDYRVAVSKVHTEILDDIDTGVLLKCELIDVFPRAEVRWQDENGTMIPFLFSESCYRGDVCNVSITAHVTRTETNIFTCVVRQPKFYHEFKQKVHVPDKMFQVCKDDSSSDVTGLSTGGWIGIVVGALLVGGLIGVFGALPVIKRRHLPPKFDSVESDDVAAEQLSSIESQLPLCVVRVPRDEDPAPAEAAPLQEQIPNDFTDEDPGYTSANSTPLNERRDADGQTSNGSLSTL